MYKISEFAAVCGTTAKTIRFYDSAGVLEADYVDPSNGYRYYKSDKVQQYYKIISLKQIGFTIDEIKTHFLNADDSAVLKVLKEKESKLLQAYQNCKGIISVYEEKIKMLNEIQSKKVNITCDGNIVVLDDGKTSARILCASDDVDKCINAFNSILNIEGFVNVDLGEIVEYVRSDKTAEVRRGFAFGEGRGATAAKQALPCNGGIKSLVITCNVSGDTPLSEIDGACTEISSNISSDAAIIWGASFTDKRDGTFEITAVCFY